MKNFMYEKFKNHIGHSIACEAYGKKPDGSFKDICVTCLCCNEILVSSEDYEEDNSQQEIMEMIQKVEDLKSNTPDGIIVDSDTILADLMEKVDFNYTCCSKEILKIWEESSDKESIEKMFEIMTDMTLKDYLEECIKKTTR